METIDTRISGGNPGPKASIDRTPDECPICHLTIKPTDWRTAHWRGDSIERLLQCPSDQCRRLFIALYSDAHQAYQNYFVYQRSVPTQMSGAKQSATIEN